MSSKVSEQQALVMDRNTNYTEPEQQYPILEGSGSKMGIGCCPFCLPQGFLGLLENNGQYVKTVQPGERIVRSLISPPLVLTVSLLPLAGCLCLCIPFENVKVMDMRMQSLSCTSDTKVRVGQNARQDIYRPTLFFARRLWIMSRFV